MFSLHPRLAEDTFVVGDLPLCRVLLMNDSQYPWLILVPREENLRELHQLSWASQQQFLRESNLAASLLEQLFRAEKLNLAALGNMVPQLHFHHIARFQDDPAWPGPVWGARPRVAYEPSLRDERLAVLKEAFTEESEGSFVIA
ncbi:HIT domain-containing protein [Spongiibacter sp. KMU-158]|uniref:HIT domain-containing protein n=1 Tax=Spongiibacter pelagi TaxID=2760804 RepID=A0A927C4D1_9GAMM|nr:HIT domain-containing protein [Spongiibacter pelagi]MBD2859792.1 HIT domain-containing protein [Spongiibacter pelagi]